MINKICNTDNNRDCVSTMMSAPSQYGIKIDSEMAKNFERKVNECSKNDSYISQMDFETVRWECETFTNKDVIKFVGKGKNILSRECDCKLHKKYDTYMRSMTILQNVQQLVNNYNKNYNHFTNFDIGDIGAIDDFYIDGLHNKERMIKCVQDITNTPFNFVYDKCDLENDESIRDLNTKSLDWLADHYINGTNDELILFIFHSSHGDNLKNDRDKILSERKIILYECIKPQQNSENNSRSNNK